MPRKKSGEGEPEPWSAQIKVVSSLLSDQEIEVPNFFTKKQVKMFAQLKALAVLYKDYLLREPETQTWVDVLVDSYMKYLKAQDGRSVKLASRVAISGIQSRMLLNLQRIKERLVGKEGRIDFDEY